MIYFDNAATSFPKPPSVSEAMTRFMSTVGANPGRSGHRLSVEAARIVYDAREKIAQLLNAVDPMRIAFTANATEALNLALFGLLKPGDHVITSGMEHNSVMRPLRVLEKGGVKLTVAPCSPRGFIDPDDVRKSLKKTTSLVVLNHGSNVNGCLQPLREIGKLARDAGALFLVDSAQTAGCARLDMQADCIDLLAFTGHKALYGPQGTGGLVLGDRVDVAAMTPLKYGGTGSRSEYEIQPDFLPDRFESGTLNTVGIAGLAAGIEFVMGHGVEAIRERDAALADALIRGLEEIPGVCVYSSGLLERQLSTVSFTIDAIPPAEAGRMLDENFGILCRIGLHCSPAAHATIGTFPDGTIRFSPGYFSRMDDVSYALGAIRELAAI